MRTTLLIIAALALPLQTRAEEPENVLDVFAHHLRESAAAQPAPIALTATLQSRGDKRFLAFRLTNISKRPLELYPWQLPWGNPHSLSFAAVTTTGTRLSNRYPIADPGPEQKVLVASGATLEGEYDIAWGLAYEDAHKTQDVLLLWAYRLTNGFERPFPICTGVAIIPKTQ